MKDFKKFTMYNEDEQITASGDTTPPAPVEEDVPIIWYTENEMRQWLIRNNYSEQIAIELSKKWADDLQGAFNKGYEKGVCYGKESIRSELETSRKENEQLREAKKEYVVKLKRSLWKLYSDVDQDKADIIQIHVIPKLIEIIDSQ